MITSRRSAARLGMCTANSDGLTLALSAAAALVPEQLEVGHGNDVKMALSGTD